MPMSPRLLRPRAPGGYRHALLRQGLVAYWTLNENAATGDILAIDETGRGNHLASNSTVPSVAGKFGNAREFVAANSEWLSSADKTDLRLGDPDWTLSAWVYVPTAANGIQFIIAKDTFTIREWNLSLERNSSTSANRFSFGVFYPALFAGSVAGPNRSNADFINRWWHVTVTNASGVVTLYENGAVVSGTGSTPTFTRASGQNYFASTSAFTIGRRIISPEGYFTGYVDEVAKWNRALSAAEISQLWNNGNGINLAAPRESTGPFAAVTNADAQDWINRVYANGGTVSTSTAAAVDTFCNDIDAAGIRDRFYRLNLFCGTGLSAALVPLYRAPSRTGTQFGNTTDTNNGPFVSGDYTESGGLVGNGTSKFLNTGMNLSELPSIATGHLSVFKGAGSAVGRVPIGCRISGSSHYYRYDLISGANRGLWGNVVIASASANTVKAHAIVSRTSSTALSVYHDGVSVATSSDSSTPSLPGREVYVFAENDGSAGSFWPHALYAYSIGLSLTAAQAASYNTAIQAFATALSR